MYTAFLPCVPTSQKGAPGLIIDGCEPPCGCWELNSGPLEEQSVLLTTEPSLQPYDCFSKNTDLCSFSSHDPLGNTWNKIINN